LCRKRNSYRNGNVSACNTLHYQLSTNLVLAGLRKNQVENEVLSRYFYLIKKFR
jgi:hypothetical protein